MSNATCSRCNKVIGKLLDSGPAPALGCNDCWLLWEESSLKIINESRLSLGDPANRELLREEQRKFFSITKDIRLS
uniref:Uncharacterized protein n=1 Tax=uncultured marine thaumarchaeote KM3_72_A09 TaxID=1456261 RepID=A0A075HJ59_9ARCH|nr:hypothetical protein [uncultured marine thaumarchaeote KM3_72_A09]